MEISTIIHIVTAVTAIALLYVAFTGVMADVVIEWTPNVFFSAMLLIFPLAMLDFLGFEDIANAVFWFEGINAGLVVLIHYFHGNAFRTHQ